MTNVDRRKATPTPLLTWEGRRSFTPCQTCGALVRWMPSVPLKYCSPECSYTGRKTGLSVEKTCEHCGKTIWTTPAKRDRTRFCGRSCASRGTSATKGRKRGTTGTKGAPPLPLGTARLDASGYTRTRIATGWQSTHRAAMEQHLGRPLLPNENVHHINGNRADNRLGNLELWVKSQPTGQRPQDLVAWARVIIERYDV